MSILGTTCFSPVICKLLNHVRDMEIMPIILFVFIVIIHLKIKYNYLVIFILLETFCWDTTKTERRKQQERCRKKTSESRRKISGYKRTERIIITSNSKNNKTKN